MPHEPRRACASNRHRSPLPPAPTKAAWSPISSTRTVICSNSSSPPN